MISKISQILKDTDITQVYGSLIRFDSNKDIVGKCALGVLACESQDKELHLSYTRASVHWESILKSYGLEDEWIYPRISSEFGWDWNHAGTNITSIIMSLNDSFHLNFKEIGEFLEVTFDL